MTNGIKTLAAALALSAAACGKGQVREDRAADQGPVMWVEVRGEKRNELLEILYGKPKDSKSAWKVECESGGSLKAEYKNGETNHGLVLDQAQRRAYTASVIGASLQITDNFPLLPGDIRAECYTWGETAQDCPNEAPAAYKAAAQFAADLARKGGCNP
ncbi:MAG: hypothetical protein M3O22_06305 [Pseudomonadota bacterium]|nr:hypothetical protein [Pseudomonadota bacterium]